MEMEKKQYCDERFLLDACQFYHEYLDLWLFPELEWKKTNKYKIKYMYLLSKA
jgi:hypothetical protein